jgi:L-amino acid N-acyltransferase YncA
MSIEFRIAQPDDADGIRAVYAPYCDSSVVSFELTAPSVEQVADRIEKVCEKYPWLICAVDGRVAGYVYACQHRERAAYRWAVDVAVYIDAAFHRRSIGRALYTSLFAMLRAQAFYKAYAGITLPNPGSVGLHEALGFTPIGVYKGVGHKFGRWLDVGWWQLDLHPETESPPEPIPFSEIGAVLSISQILQDGEQLARSGSIP